MSYAQFQPAIWRTIGFIATILLSLPEASAVQPPPAETPQASGSQTESAPPDAAQSEESAPEKQPAGRQLGDDVAQELKDPEKKPDAKKIESQAAFMEGLAAQKRGDLNDAIKAFRRASEADPTAVEPVRAHAILLRRLGKVSQAEAMARKAIELDKDDYEMRLELAGLLLSRRNPEEATGLIDEALQSKRLDRASAEFVNLHSVRGRIYLLTRNAAKAAESYAVILDALEKPEDFGLDFRQHQTLMNDRATGYDTVGKIMLEVGNNDKAEAAFGALVKISNDTPGDHHYWLSLAQYRKDDLKAANKNLERYFESNRRSRDSLQLLSDIYRADSRSEDVVERLTKLAENSSDADTVNLFLGDLLVEKGEGDRAAKVYQAVIADSGNADAYLGLVRVDILKRSAAGLRQTVNKALRARIQREELVPLMPYIMQDTTFAQDVVKTAVASITDSTIEKNPAATYFYSQIAERLEMPEQEGGLLQATLEQNPEPRLGVEALGQLGMNLFQRDDFTEAAETFKKLLAIPGLPKGERLMTLYRLSFAEAENGNYDVAITAVEAALQLEPNHPQLTYQLGTIQLQAKQYENAEKTLKTAVRLSEAEPQLESQSRLLLGGLYTQIGRWDDAINAYRELLEMPELKEAAIRRGRMMLSNAYVQKGDVASGEKILEEVYKQDPEDIGVNNDLGYLYADQNKNLEQAEEMVRIAVEAEPENPAYLDSLGWVLYRLEKFEEAEKVLLKANSDPDYRDSTIIEHLGDVQEALNKLKEAAKAWQEALEVERKSASPDQAVIERLTEKLKAAESQQ